jgi:lysophospholipase L1-like esterase
MALQHPDYLKQDGFHLSRSGATAYAAAIAVAIHALVR